MNTWKRAGIALAMLLSLMLLCCGCGNASGTPGSDAAPQGAAMTQQRAAVKESAFITIDINPGVELVINSEHIVTVVHGTNADGELLLWQEEGILGQPLEQAVAKIASLALEMGYLTESTAGISVTVATESGATEQALLVQLTDTLTDTAAQAGLEVRVEHEIDLVLSRELARLKQDNAGKDGYDETLTLSRYRLVCAAMHADRTLAQDDAVRLPNDRLIEMVRKTQSDGELPHDHTCEEAQSEAEFVYENAKQALLDSAYTAEYAARLNLSSLFANHGATYAGCRLAYRTVEHYAQGMREQIEDPTLSEDDVRDIATMLGIDTTDAQAYDRFRDNITDEQGDITQERVCAWINAKHKSGDAQTRAEMEQAYDEVLVRFDELRAQASVVSDEGKSFLRATLFGLGIPMEVETYDDLPALLHTIQGKIDAAWEKMESDLTENEKQSVLERQEKMEKTIAEYERVMTETIAEAHRAAQARMDRAKQDREQNKGE